MKLTAEEVLREHLLLTERLVNPDKLAAGYAKAFAADKALKATADEVPAVTAMMFYPYDMQSADGPREFMRSLGRSLAQARDYQVAGPMVELADQLFLDAKNRVYHLDEAELPSEHGFMWFDKTPVQRDTNGLNLATSAVSWGILPVLMPQAQGSPQWEKGVRLTFWTAWDVPEGMDEYTDSFYREAAQRGDADREETRRRLTAQFGNLTFSHSVVVPFGVRFEVEENPGFGDPVIALIHVIWMLMDMEVLTSSGKAALPRAARRRALRSLRHGEVNVIMLRRTRPLHEDSDAGPGYVQWNCRWVVQGHWRNYQDGRRTWVRPYIKGPDGLPIKDSKQLWRLAR